MRPIEDRDIRDATKALKMARMAVGELVDLRNRHIEARNINVFASQVIAAAAQLELERRRCPERAPWV